MAFNLCVKGRLICLKRIILLVICLILIVGCGKRDIINQNSNESERIEVEFWYGLTGVQGFVMEQFINDYNSSQEMYFVKGVSFDSYDVTARALESALIKGKGPSVVLLEDYQMIRFTEKGGLRHLDDLVKNKNGFNIEDFVPKFLNQVMYNNNIYGIPIYGTTQILYYRKDLFEQAEVDPSEIETWEGLAKAAKKLRKIEQDQVMVYGWEPMQGRENLIDASINRGGKIISDDGKKVLIAEKPWVETWEKFRQWIHDDKIMKVHFGGEGWEYWYATIDDVLQGRAAGYTGSAGDFKELDFNIISASVQPYWKGYDSNPVGVYNAHTICIPIFTDDKEAKAAFEWINYFTSTEITAKWSMETGYIPVRQSAIQSRKYQEYINENPSFKVTLEQMEKATNITADPTGGEIYEALRIAAEKVQILNIPADIALEEARQMAQSALDTTNNRLGVD